MNTNTESSLSIASALSNPSHQAKSTKGIRTYLARVAMLRALSHRPFALLWSGQALSRIGDHLYQTVLLWWVLQTTGSPTAMGMVLLLSLTPMLLFLLIGGVTVDRFCGLRLMVASDLGRGLLMSVVSVLAFQHHLTLGHIYLVSILFGAVDAFFQPAYSASVPQTVPEAALPSANALTNLSQQMGRILGPALAAILVGLGGTSAAFALNGLSFFLSAACLLPMARASRLSTSPRVERSSGVLGDLREGIGTVLGSPRLWIGIVVFALANVTLVGPYSIALPWLVKNGHHAGVGTLGMLYALFALGYVVSEAWMGRYTRLRWRGPVLYGGVILAGGMFVILGLPVSLACLGIAAFVNGAALEASGLIWMNLLQSLVPRDLLGRVSSLDMLGSYLLMPVGFALTGWAVARIGAPMVFLAGGVSTVLLGLMALLSPQVRRLD